jgi:hypothetical protein
LKIRDYILVIGGFTALFYFSAVSRIYFFEGKLVFNIFTKDRVVVYLLVIVVVVAAYFIKEKFIKSRDIQEP